ncbi:unnamed protein product [Caenorhabditis bovis]|uniref:Uncharacterized protein n=1 Tax=Caenorhabditis bovis TaxID=2654633 RepID=A0A8S1FBB0_9PELO|nr:unnamed protein product [Caenorhabditis bovis]
MLLHIFYSLAVVLNAGVDGRIKELLGEKTIEVNTTQEAVLDLSNHWIEQAFSALLATVAQEKVNEVPHLEMKLHEKCVKSIKTIEAHAKCVSEILDVSRLHKNREAGVRRMVHEMRQANSNSEWIGSFRVSRRKRHIVVNRDSYTLKSSSPFSKIAKTIVKTVRNLKNKKETRNWRQIMVDVKQTGEIIEKRKKVREMLSKSIRSSRPRRILLSPRDEFRNDESMSFQRPLAVRNDIDSGEDEVRSKTPVDAEKLFHQIQEHPETILSDEAPNALNMTTSEQESILKIKLIREAVKMGLSLTGQNVTGIDHKNMRFASPRFFAIAPEPHKTDNDMINILSPSLFSLHDEGTEDERNTSLHKLLSLPTGSSDKDAWIDMLTEITGIADSVDDAAKKVSQQSDGVLMNANGEEVAVSKENLIETYGAENYRKIKTLEKLHQMYTPEQLEHFNTTGYAVMTDEQREMVYGKGSPFENPVTYEAGKNLTIGKAKRAMHSMIREIGKGNLKIDKYDKRMKDIVASPVLFSSIIGNAALASQPLILSPVLFTSIVLSPSIWGAVILSPWVFVPVILAPRILAPIIVSPAIFSPIVLSPLALDPLVLVPGVGNPVVLSPFILTPFILSPQVMTPIILTPFALSPFILTPTALSPLILSPFVLSPAILSPSFATAVILSPYALSPSILSPPTMISVFASPSILS